MDEGTKDKIKWHLVKKTSDLLREPETQEVLDTADVESAALGMVEGFAYRLASACVGSIYGSRGEKLSERHKNIVDRMFIGIMACATDLMQDAARWDVSGN